jgi:lysophospholipase L1-like esterase
VRQDYVPLLFLDARDTLAASSDLGLDRTATSNLLFAHSSIFWDTRSAIRTQILNHMVPHLEDLFSLAIPRPAIPEGPEFERIAIPRLQNLRELCESHGAKLILLIPPTLSSQSAVSQMAYTAHTAGVETSVPVDPAALSAKFYQPDGMHLNPEGAAIFTSALAKDLPEKVVVHNTLASRN